MTPSTQPAAETVQVLTWPLQQPGVLLGDQLVFLFTG